MKFAFTDRDISSILFHDNICILLEDGTEYEFYIQWDEEKHFSLYNEDFASISYLYLDNSKLHICYTTGNSEVLASEIKKIKINCYKFRRSFLIEGRLLKYNCEMANKYNLDEELASFSYSLPLDSFIKPNHISKKRIIETKIN